MRKTHSLRCGLLLATLLAAAAPAAAKEKDACAGSRDMALVNGRIHTMDAKNSVVSAVTIKDGKFAIIGQGTSSLSPCTQKINLRGRTVIPGLIDNHVHILLSGIRPGHETREIETAFTIAEAVAVIREKAKRVPKGEAITAIGGLQARQFAENRLPNLAELDSATTDHPVYIHSGFAGPSTTNTMGRTFLVSRGVTVGTDGSIAGGTQSFNAFIALDSLRSFADRKKTTLDIFDYFLGLGITTAHAVGGSQAQGPGFFDPAVDHNVLLSLLREDKVKMRLRIYFNALDDQSDHPKLREILDNVFNEYGGDLVRNAGLGEHLVSLGLEAQVPLGQLYLDGALKLAGRGWQLMEHSFNEPNHATRADVWEMVNVQFPLAPLRWSIDHVFTIEPATIDRLKAIGASVRAHPSFRYISGSPTANGPPLRRLIDSGIRLGVGSDAAQAAPINPWLNVYYMVTGKDSLGRLINDGQQITRKEAIRLYTASNGWFSYEEDKLGSVEPGKLADLVVLSDDLFDEKNVSDEAIKRLHSVLTIVGGKVVFGTVAPDRGDDDDDDD